MGNKIESSVEINGVLEHVSIALNGLFKHEDLQKISTKYEIDSSVNNIKKFEPNIKQLFKSGIHKLTVEISKLDINRTTVHYKIEYSMKRQMMIIGILFSIFTIIFVGIGVALSMSAYNYGTAFSGGEMIMSIVFLVLMPVLICLIPLIVFILQNKPKNRNAMFRRLFLERLTGYIKIVEKEHMK